jgi:hypothetical protein
MRIHDKRLNGVSPNKKSAKSGSVSGEFRTILQQRLEAMRDTGEVDAQLDVEQLEAWGMVEEATHMLDKALEQIQNGNEPAEDLIQALQELRGKLQVKSDSKVMREVNALLAVESERLRGLA